jgi:Phosphotransferase enzyme family
MTFVLNSENVLSYLQDSGMGIFDPQTTSLKKFSAKNFNILVTAPNVSPLLVKQEPLDINGEQPGELFVEWQLQQLIAEHSTLSELAYFMPTTLHCDRANFIVVNQFLLPYDDLQDYYENQREYPTSIASEIGQHLGLVHRLTYSADWQKLLENTLGKPRNRAQRAVRRLGRLHSGIFAITPIDCIRFYKLYQQYPSLGAAVEKLANNSLTCCLVHNDLKLNNILLHHLESPPANESKICLIDWERACWGDPANDLGLIINSYLQLWLENLVVSSDLTMNESLQLALVPLSSLQPSLFALVDNYRQTFPQVFVDQPQFLERVLQYTGLELIRRIEVIIEDNRVFDNRGIAILQVAKQLLCEPTAFMQTIFGSAAEQLKNL